MKRRPLPISPCPEELPKDLHAAIERFAQLWQASQLRPRVTERCLAQWKALIEEWLTAEDLPVFIRSGAGQRGHALTHLNHRIIVGADNSPAHWALSLALQDQCPTLDAVRAAFQADAIPVCMALENGEKQRAKYRCNRQMCNLNKLGWKVCHRVGVGERRPKISATSDWERIRSHFTRFISPANMFVVPKKWSGLGELASVIRTFGDAP